MSTPATNYDTILVATDNVTDATMVKHHLEEEFGNVFTTTDPDRAAQDFEECLPAVIVLAFADAEKSESFYLGLYRLCPIVQQHPHRTVILCGKDQVKRVYERCKKNLFDDYVLFWPMTYDMLRLSMSIHHLLRELAALRDGGPSAAQFAIQARRLAELEGLLERQMANGSQHIAGASRDMAQAEQNIGKALDGFSQRLIDGKLANVATINRADELRAEIYRLKREEVGEQFRQATTSATGLTDWASDMLELFAPHLESIRALGALAERVQSTVLMVDDDEFQRKIVGDVLADENYRLLFAADGFEALNVLRKSRPDLILMDVKMPVMDGFEALRRLKATPQFTDIPVAILTGKSQKDVVIESLKLGAIGFLVKPLDRDTLILKVREALNGA